MSKRYSIDEPGLDDGLEEDIVLGSFHPTERDRDLLRADEAVLKDIQKKSSPGHNSSPFFSGKSIMKKYKKLVNESKSHKKRVGFAPLSSDDNSSANSGGYAKLDDSTILPLHNSKHSQGPSRHNEPVQYGDSDSDSDDIQIDIQDGLSRGELRRRSRRIHGAILLFVGCVFAWLAYKQIIPSFYDDSNSKYRHYYPHSPSKVLSNGTHEFKPTTLLVSLDGFHPHYVSEEITPNLHKLMLQGGGAPYMIPSFPSSTFPNHWSMITGLYPANHGIVGNTFWDAKIQKQFFNTKPEQSLDKAWWGGQPIWVTAARQGVSTAVHMWPGSEVEWDEGSMLEVDNFNATETLETKANRVFSWIDREKSNRPELILSYVPTIDAVGHKNGIAGDELVSALKDVDSMVGAIMSGISSRNLTNIVNLVVVSDHGMAPTSNNRLIYLDDLVEMSNIEHVDGWPLIALRPKSSLDLKALYRNLVDAQKQYGEGKWDVFLREDLPAEWKFGGYNYNKWQNRLAPLWLVPKVGWAFTTKEQMKKQEGDYKPHGIHGYNNTEVLMRALFLTQGPYFTKDYLMPFENVGLYTIVCGSVGLKPSKADGPSFSEIFRILPTNWTDPVEYPDVPFKTEILKFNSTYDTLFRKRQAIANPDEQSKSTDTVKEGTDDKKVEVASAAPPSKNNSEDKKADSKTAWRQWMDYFSDKASQVGDWISAKVDKIKGKGGKNDEPTDSKDSKEKQE